MVYTRVWEREEGMLGVDNPGMGEREACWVLLMPGMGEREAGWVRITVPPEKHLPVSLLADTFRTHLSDSF